MKKKTDKKKNEKKKQRGKSKKKIIKIALKEGYNHTL